MILKKILIFYKNGSKRTSLKNKPKKYHVHLSTGKNSSLRVEFSITNSKCEKFLEIKKKKKRKKFLKKKKIKKKKKKKKASQKLSILLRVVWSLSFPRRKFLLNAFITSVFIRSHYLAVSL